MRLVPDVPRQQGRMILVARDYSFKEDKTGAEISRIDPVRTVRKYVVTALDELTPSTDWYGSIIPYFWILGPEIYIKGKLHRLSLITAAIELIRYKPHMAERMVTTLVDQPQKITACLGQFTVEFERALGITRPS